MTEEILKKLANVETVEELNAVLAENSIQLEEGVTPEAFLAAMNSGGDELNEDDLGEVAGGLVVGMSIGVAMAAAALGMSLGMSVAYYLKKYRNRK